MVRPLRIEFPGALYHVTARGNRQAAIYHIPRLQQRRPPARSLAEIEHAASNRNDAIVAAYATGAYSYQDLARHFGVHFTTVGRIVRRGCAT